MAESPKGVVVDPRVLIAGGAVAVLGLVVLSLFLWMVPTAAKREQKAACTALGGLQRLDRVRRPDGRSEPENHGSAVLCPGGQPCELPIAAPDFTALDHNGKPVKLSDFRGKVVLLNFWASWCGVCKTEKPRLAQMAEELAGGDFVVVALASDRTWTDVLLAIVEALSPRTKLPDGDVALNQALDIYRAAMPSGVPFNVLVDPPQGEGNIGKIAASWGITAVPESALIDRNGNIRAYFVNKRDWESPVAETCLRSVIDE